ncbi:MAG: chemotaxis protein CheB, partial [Chloroflexota bacterium]
MNIKFKKYRYIEGIAEPEPIEPEKGIDPALNSTERSPSCAETPSRADFPAGGRIQYYPSVLPDPEPRGGSGGNPSRFRAGVVGIGASAGGLEALESFFKFVGGDTGLAFVVIHRLASDYKNLLIDLFAKHARMPAIVATEGLEAEPNTIYLSPPSRIMTIRDGRFRLEDDNEPLQQEFPVDEFFRALADDYGERAIGVILSGTGEDGAAGCRAIKGAGGVIFVQDSTSSKFDAMPRSVISAGAADFIMTPAKMGAQ